MNANTIGLFRYAISQKIALWRTLKQIEESLECDLDNIEDVVDSYAASCDSPIQLADEVIAKELLEMIA